MSRVLASPGRRTPVWIGSGLPAVAFVWLIRYGGRPAARPSVSEGPGSLRPAARTYVLPPASQAAAPSAASTRSLAGGLLHDENENDGAAVSAAEAAIRSRRARPEGEARRTAAQARRLPAFARARRRELPVARREFAALRREASGQPWRAPETPADAGAMNKKTRFRSWTLPAD